MATQQRINDRKTNEIERIAHGDIIHIHTYLSRGYHTLSNQKFTMFLIKNLSPEEGK